MLPISVNNCRNRDFYNIPLKTHYLSTIYGIISMYRSPDDTKGRNLLGQFRVLYKGVTGPRLKGDPTRNLPYSGNPSSVTLCLVGSCY